MKTVDEQSQELKDQIFQLDQQINQMTEGPAKNILQKQLDKKIEELENLFNK